MTIKIFKKPIFDKTNNTHKDYCAFSGFQKYKDKFLWFRVYVYNDKLIQDCKSLDAQDSVTIMGRINSIGIWEDNEGNSKTNLIIDIGDVGGNIICNKNYVAAISNQNKEHYQQEYNSGNNTSNNRETKDNNNSKENSYKDDNLNEAVDGFMKDLTDNLD